MVDPQLTDIARFHMRLRGARVGAAAFGIMDFGSRATLLTPPLDGLYAFFGARADHIVCVQRDQATRSERGDGRVGVVNSFDPVMAHFNNGTELFQVSFSRAAVEAELEEEIGHAVTKLRFPPAFPATGPLRTYHAILTAVADEIAQPTGLLDRPSVADRLGAALLTTMLHTSPHQYADELAAPAAPSPRPVRRVTEAMRADPAHPFTAVELARLSGVPLRSLQAAFRAHHGIPMMTYLRHLRLDGVHRDLHSELAPGTTVADVATRWGFTHLSRFSAYYSSRHGALPSEHLRNN
ncbi:AraC family transcriptional regulator [Streptomyces sp. BH-SS-21]|uniref:AraC family transcriptional regulator n=1 Tax=Streptomyces liliiviolaceus TaxID=2823109 RepID=A0A940XSR0_9ACTN|nr:helix-turn-helix transcriptional regulator [Streptomyces liliiviolaceus]MBQ0848873.1 AraC family transcriptional regulator [Streptomyces liliiviolaceus]